MSDFVPVTASGIDRMLACPASVVLPRAYRSTTYSEAGNAKHSYVRAVLAGSSVSDAIGAVDPEYRETCRRIDWEKLTGDLEPSTIQSEVAYAIDVKRRTARFLGVNIARDYVGAAKRTGTPLNDDEVTGSLDIEGLRYSDGFAVIRDMKTGFMDVPKPATNGQSLFFAAVKQMMGVSDVLSEIAKIKDDGSVWLDGQTLTSWETDPFLDALAEGLERARRAKRVYLAGGPLNVSEGPWCEWCSAFDACPAKNALVKSLLTTLDGYDLADLPHVAPADAGRAYVELTDRVLPVAERMVSVLRERAKFEALPVSDGKELREVAFDVDRLQTEALLELARAKGATDAEIADCYKSKPTRTIRVCNTKRRRAA